MINLVLQILKTYDPMDQNQLKTFAVPDSSCGLFLIYGPYANKRSRCAYLDSKVKQLANPKHIIRGTV